MPALLVIEHLDVIEDVTTDFLQGVIGFRLIRFRFGNWKKLSATALPCRLMLGTKRWAFKKSCQ
jgi:hypothetical protein